jgi:KDO2-lipid IV(A) lauroyltransferase
MTHKQIRKRHKVINPEVLDKFNTAGRSVIGTPCHYGNWEWGSVSGSIQLPQSYVVFYKPLGNKWIDKFARWSRAKFSSQLVSIFNTQSVFQEHALQNSIFIMAADQSPSNTKKAYWVNFLGKETAFLHGPEDYARQYNLPVVFVDIQRVKRGFYELKLEIITENPTELEVGEITQRYAKRLETAILNKPENWLWSHKRWKHVKQNL